MGDDVLVEGLVNRLRRFGLPVCPRMRPAPHDWSCHPAGYCVLDGSAGRCMLPSTEEIQTYCTTPRYHSCPWFTDAPGAWKRLGPPT